jgi:hypothetical protein
MHRVVRRPRTGGAVDLPRFLYFLRPSKRTLWLFALLTVFGWALLMTTFICWDGIDPQGRPVGACEVLGGNGSFLIIPPVAYLLAAAIATWEARRAVSRAARPSN